MKRRDLLKLSTLAGAGLLLPGCRQAWDSLFTSPPETLYTGHRSSVDPDAKTVLGYAIASPTQTQTFALRNEIHSVVHSRTGGIRILFPKYGDQAVALSSSGERTLSPAAGNLFYGHAAVDEKRSLLYTTQAKVIYNESFRERQDAIGKIFVYKLPELTLVDEFPTFGNDPHDLVILGDRLVVCNGGIDSNVALINLSNRKLLRSYPNKDPAISMAHCAVVDHENLVVAPLSPDFNRPLPLYLLNLRQGLRPFPTPDTVAAPLMRVQLLSVLAQGNFIFATCPSTNSVLMWHRTGDFIKGHQIPRPTSLAYSPSLRGVLVGSADASVPLHLIKTESADLDVVKLSWGERATGPHSLLLA